MRRGGAVEKENSAHARGPGFYSWPGNFFPLFWAVLFCFVSFLIFFLPIGWFQFILGVAPLHIREVLR